MIDGRSAHRDVCLNNNSESQCGSARAIFAMLALAWVISNIRQNMNVPRLRASLVVVLVILAVATFISPYIFQYAWLPLTAVWLLSWCLLILRPLRKKAIVITLIAGTIVIALPYAFLFLSFAAGTSP
jgi:hypothetical protein